jgi:hypothetical protein
MLNGCARQLVVDRALSTRHLVDGPQACDPGPEDGNSTPERGKHGWLDPEIQGVVEPNVSQCYGMVVEIEPLR